MPCERRAVIDIGTNSVKLLVGDVSDNNVVPVLETSHQTRLGRDFYETHVLQPGAIQQTADGVADFVGESGRLDAASIVIIATSAVRDAHNRKELVDAVRGASGLPLRIITGNEEADYAYKGVLTDPKFANQHLLLLDMGGGSTEFVLGHGAHVRFRHSFALGTLRLMDALHISDPPVLEELEACYSRALAYLHKEARPLLAPALEHARKDALAGASGAVKLVGTGGTAGILARMDAGLETYDRDAMEAVVIPTDRLRAQTERLWSLAIEERRKIVGLPPRRADVILTGAAAYLCIMEEFGFETLRVSTRGLRFAALLEPVEKRGQP
jgi:exopolyphosphatase/guanosine-5'-triphosphate,3'-diphosphate pyrophosphatase